MKWNIGTKIGSGFALALAVLIVVGTVSYLSTTKLVEASVWVERTHEVIDEARNVLSAIKDGETGQRGFVITGEEKFLAPYEDARVEASAALERLRTLTRDNAVQRGRVDDLGPLVVAKFDHMEKLVAARRAEGLEAAASMTSTDEGRALMERIRNILDDFVRDEHELLAKRAADEGARARFTERTIIGGIAAGVLLLGAVGFALTRNIAGPLGAVTDAARRISGGDLSVSLPAVSRTDEIGALVGMFGAMTKWLGEMARAAGQIASGDLAGEVKPLSEQDTLGRSFAAMRDGLRRSTREIQEAASVLASSSSEIMASTSQVAAGASETATAVAETTTTVEEVKQTAQVATQKARLVSETAQKAALTAQGGSRSVEDSIEGMRRIQEQMESIAETVVRLSEQSQAIGDIVATVTDIAEQSNLLAVNAAIEAARAGEQGRGFAVVAQEVKSLADQSKQATGQVRGILNDIQKAISGAVMATEQGGKTVEAGVRQAEEAGEAIRMLSDTIEAGAQAALQIAASSQQQSVGMDQVASAMENIKQATSQNVAGTRQAEVAARSLHDIGLKLKELVGQYNL